MVPSSISEPSSLDIPRWLKTLPLAPEYHPTLEEFEDPISYILKIENEASEYGICKIVPPLHGVPKKTLISNFNRSLSSRNPNSEPTFTSRLQQLGFCSKTPRLARRVPCKSGESYNFKQFEVRAKQFESNFMNRSENKTNMKKRKKKKKERFLDLEMEAMFWKEIGNEREQPITVEYASDITGSAFVPVVDGKKVRRGREVVTVGESEWNIGGVSRAKGSLLRFMEEEIPGVNSPVLDLSMMFSWFAWHTKDHDLHSLNYMHIGAARTWYGVPGDAGGAFEEVVRVHGYGGDVNPLVTFATLGEKTTVMSPKVLIDKRIPCCRLVQNAGEFVVTFPRAYHSSFSHGFNCCEAANIATPKWLMVAKEAAIRRASAGHPPMVSHFQLLYALALSSCSRVPKSINTNPCSLRVKDKKIEGEMMIKELFVQDVMQNDDFIHDLLEQGSSCVLLQQIYSDASEFANLHARMRTKVRPRLSLGLFSFNDEIEASKDSLSNDILKDRNTWFRPLTSFCSVRKRSSFVSERNKSSSLSVKNDQCGDGELCSSTLEIEDMISENQSTSQGHSLSGQDLFSCVACGISNSACLAILRPREAAAHYLMSADFSFFNDWLVGSGALDDRCADGNEDSNNSEPNSCSCLPDKTNSDDLYDVPVQSASYQQLYQRVQAPSGAEAQRSISSLDLLAVAYGSSSDSEEEPFRAEMPLGADENENRDSLPPHKEEENSRSAGVVLSSQTNFLCDNSTLNGLEQDHTHCTSLRLGCGNAVPFEISRDTNASFRNQEWGSVYVKTRSKQSHKSDGSGGDRIAISGQVIGESVKACSGVLKSEMAVCDFPKLSNCTHDISKCAPDMLVKSLSEEYSSRNHIFCLEHAVEAKKQLQSIGGVHLLLLCHPEYPKVVAGAKSFAKELGIDYLWKDIPFREATKEDQERIQSALHAEEARAGNEDWAVKLGIGLSYVARLGRSSLYSKQMPYNSVIYKAFGCSSPARSTMKLKVPRKRLGNRNKLAVGKWCGKVWMSNQVHPYLAQRDTNEGEPSASVKSRVIPELKTDTEPHFSCLDEQTPLPEQNYLPSAATGERKAGKKRKKMTTEERVSKKPKYVKLDGNIEAVKNSPENISTGWRQSTSRSRQMKQKTAQFRDSKAKNNLQHSSKVKKECAGGSSRQLRRTSKLPPKEDTIKPTRQNQSRKKKEDKKTSSSGREMQTNDEAKYQCDMDGCTMGFRLKQELVLHKNNICPVRGCGKKFFAHKYLVQHKRVHVDDRPLKCPWKGCNMTFKWPWARTEHIRVHTGVRPYVCHEPDCGQTFRFVSDFSRHKRKTGHSGKKKKKKGGKV